MKNLIVFSFLIILLFSCKKEEKQHFYVPSEFKRWTVFNKGSYWIFQNDSTLEIDSTYIKDNPISFNVPSSNSNYNSTSEKIEISYSSIFLGKAILRLDLYGQATTMYFYVCDFDTYGLIANSLDNFVPYIQDSYTKTTYETLSFDSIYYLGLRKFNTVVNTQITKNSKTLNLWFAKDIGLIKIVRESNDSTLTWSLLRYKINR